MKLYHGTVAEFDAIDLAKSRPFKDFGQGFYLSDNYDQALKMAQYKSIQVGTTPIVYEYDFDEAYMQNANLNVLKFEHYSLEWAQFVFKNRDENNLYKHDYDIVYGPIANDKVGMQMRLLKENNITIEVFLERLKYFKGITFQYMFATDTAIKLLSRI